MFFQNLLKSGWLHALFIAVVAYPLGAITAKLVASNMDCNILVYTVIFTISSAVALLIKSGPGSLGIQTLKRPETWLYAVAQIFVLIFGILIMQYVTATEGAGLYRVTGLFVLILSMMFLAQKVNKYEVLSSLIICLGLFFILSNSNISFEFKCLLFLFVCCRALAQSSQKIITELHKTSRKSKNTKDDQRVAGFIMIVAGIFMLIVLLIVAYLKQYNDILLFKSFPHFEDFAHLNGYIMAVVMGLFIVSVSKYCEFYAGKTIGARYLTSMLSLQIIFVYFIENILSYFNIMNKTDFAFNDYIGIGLILLGNIIIAFAGFIKDLSFIKKGEKQDTLANLDENFIDEEDDFEVVKLNVFNLLSLYNNDSKKLSEDIGVNRVLLDNIANYDFGEFKLQNKIAYKINSFASKNVRQKPIIGII
ncbi:MAG: hypothetical protein CFH44_00494 [Proteobacteria bacterium]|nr:MAG: hypothetical protein CFH44_00494 [Pseudomonadota bacterium]|tara:strand:- start:268 stop:1527 length:1260 start_codon:yes stop_codon:yes gene_type:complete